MMFEMVKSTQNKNLYSKKKKENSSAGEESISAIHLTYWEKEIPVNAH